MTSKLLPIVLGTVPPFGLLPGAIARPAQAPQGQGRGQAAQPQPQEIGGLPVIKDGKVVAAIGCGGSLPANDEKFAQAGLNAMAGK